MVSLEPQESSPDGRRAHVTLLFSDLCNYTALGEIGYPEETDAFRRRLETMAATVVRKHLGVVSQCYGDGLLAIFGLPVGTEDHSRRALEAALEIHSAARSLSYGGESAPDFEVRMHSGVHAGLVFVREGDSLHGAYDITGDAVSTAARLSAAAGSDEILVSATTFRGIEAFFAAEPAQQLALKGKRVPVWVHRVVERSMVRTRFEARTRVGLTPLAGRGPELQQLMSALELSRREKGQVALVVGAPGIGKTRLLEEFRQRASAVSTLVLHGSCDSYGEIPPLEPFLQVLKQLFGIELGTSFHGAAATVESKLAQWSLAEHTRTFLSLLSLGQPSAKGEAFETTEASSFQALVALVEALARCTPVALVLDDWQWADEFSQKLFVRMAPHFEACSVCVVVGMRDEAGGASLPPPSVSLSLEPLSHDEAREVIAFLRDEELDVGLTTALYERSGGNPLYLEELCHTLPGDELFDVQALGQSRVPNTLQGLIQARTAKLQPPQMRALQRASVVGMEFSIAVLAANGEPGQTEQDVARLVREGFLYPASGSDTFRFKHGIAREVVYAGVLINDRRRIHHEIASALERTVAANHLIDQSEALAFHYRGSGDHLRAAQHAERAGDKAAGSSFLKSARAHYEAALESLDRIQPSTEIKRSWLRVAGKWAVQCAYAPMRTQLKILKRADAYAVELNDIRARAHNSHMLGWFHYVFGDYEESIEHCERAFALARESADAKLLVQMLTSLGQAYCISGRYPRALEFLTEGIEQKRARVSGIVPVAPSGAGAAPVRRAPPLLYAHSLTCRAMIYADLGDFELADQDLEEALQIVAGTGHAMEPSVLSHQAIIQIRRGDWPGCYAASARGCKIAERVNSTFVYGMCSAYEGYSQWRLQSNAEALRRVKRAVDWLEARDFGLYISFVYACLAEALCESGDLLRAEDYAQRAVTRALVGDPQGEVAAYRVLASVAQRQHCDASSTESWLRRAIDAAVARGSTRELALTSLCFREICGRGEPALPSERLHAAGLLSDADTLAALERMKMVWYAERARKAASQGAQTES